MGQVANESPLSKDDERRQTAELLAMSQRHNSTFFFLSLVMGVLFALLMSWLVPGITRYTLWAVPFVLTPPLAISGYRCHWHRTLQRRLLP